MSAAAGVIVGKRLGRKEYHEAYTESKKIMYAGLAVSACSFFWQEYIPDCTV